MKQFIVLCVLIILSFTLYASVVYYGEGKAVFLEDTLELKSGQQIIGAGSGTGIGFNDFLDLNNKKITELATPTASTDAATKQYVDDGTYGLPLMAKGSLITSNGTANGEFSACSNGQHIEWDSTETSGIKCVSDSIATGSVVNGSVSSATLTTVTNASVTITADGQPIEVGMIATESGDSCAGSQSGFRTNSGPNIVRYDLQVSSVSVLGEAAGQLLLGNAGSDTGQYAPCSSLKHIVTSPGTGSTTYTALWSATTGTINVDCCKMYARILR